MDRQPLLPRPTYPFEGFHPVPIDLDASRELGEVLVGAEPTGPDDTPRPGGGPIPVVIEPDHDRRAYLLVRITKSGVCEITCPRFFIDTLPLSVDFKFI